MLSRMTHVYICRPIVRYCLIYVSYCPLLSESNWGIWQ